MTHSTKKGYKFFPNTKTTRGSTDRTNTRTVAIAAATAARAIDRRAARGRRRRGVGVVVVAARILRSIAFDRVRSRSRYVARRPKLRASSRDRRARARSDPTSRVATCRATSDARARTSRDINPRAVGSRAYCAMFEPMKSIARRDARFAKRDPIGRSRARDSHTRVCVDRRARDGPSRLEWVSRATTEGGPEMAL